MDSKEGSAIRSELQELSGNITELREMFTNMGHAQKVNHASEIKHFKNIDQRLTMALEYLLAAYSKCFPDKTAEQGKLKALLEAAGGLSAASKDQKNS